MIFKKNRLVQKRKVLGKITIKQACIYYRGNIEKCKSCDFRYSMIIKWKVNKINKAISKEPGEMGWPDSDKNYHYHLYCDLNRYLGLINKKIDRRAGTAIHIKELINQSYLSKFVTIHRAQG